MSNNTHTRDLLKYDARHKVLICRECKYAIQKNALQSHLLRHKIYRGERRRLLSSVAQLRVLDPDAVRLPDAGSPPIDGLPIIPGYRCASAGCESLCASTKRMRRHWSEIHGVSDPDPSFARSVSLQTFFRGTKIRYFEVVSPADAVVESSDSRNATPVEPGTVGLGSAPDVPPTLPELSFEMLRYFHHFTTNTSLTLPSNDQPSNQFWQLEVVTQALKIRWLMCGLLAISASHLVTLSCDETARSVHMERAGQFTQEFQSSWEQIKKLHWEINPEEFKTGAQMACIQRCYTLTRRSPSTVPVIGSGPAPIPIHTCIMAIQGCHDPSAALHVEFGRVDAGEASIPARGNVESAPDDSNHAPSASLERLHMLPFRMSQVLGRPTNATDILTTLAAINTLVECYSLSYDDDTVGGPWTGMASWLRRISDHFKELVSQGSPGPLIVLAHWLPLVQRAESQCWFLRGLSAALQSSIEEALVGDIAMHNLVQDLLT